MSQSPDDRPPFTDASAGPPGAGPAGGTAPVRPVREDLGPDEEDLDVDPPGSPEPGPDPRTV